MDMQAAVDVGDALEWLNLAFLDRLQGITPVSGRIELGIRPGVADRYHFWSDMRGSALDFPSLLTSRRTGLRRSISRLFAMSEFSHL